MNEATKQTDEIHVEDLDVDQERKIEKDPETMEERIASERLTRHIEATEEAAGQAQAGSFATTAELVDAEIRDIHDRPFNLPNQPAGVFAAISAEANKFIEVIMKSFDKSQIGAMEIFEKGAKEFGAEGEVAEQLEREAAETIVKKTIPLIIEILAKDAPEFMSKVVAMILEPHPEKIRKNETLTYTPERVLWEIPVSEQVQAISFYIDSLNLGALKKKVRSFRQA